MKLGYTIIYVADVKQTVDFYQRAFGLTLKFITETNEYAEMNTGEVTLAFAAEAFTQQNGLKFKINRADQASPGFEIALVAENIHESFALALKEGAIEVAKPIPKPWGQTVGYVTDNNGILIEICSKCTACH